MAKVTKTKYTWFLQVDKHLNQIREIIRLREKIWLLTPLT